MASPDNLYPTPSSWCFRPDPLLQIFARDDYALVTRALQMSFSSDQSQSQSPTPDPPSPLRVPTPAAGSDPELLPKRRRIPVTTTKRKSRASKRSNTTTFITADPANFRHMVQQVTGLGIGTQVAFPTTVLKPEPHRMIMTTSTCGGRLPTLDTSEYLLLDHQEDQFASHPTTTASLQAAHDGGFFHFPAVGVDTLPVFPTLESWEVM